MSTLMLVTAALSGGPVALITKVTAILVVALCAAGGMRRTSAAARHLVWFAAVSACAAVAVLSPLVHGIAVTVPVPTQPAISAAASAVPGVRLDTSVAAVSTGSRTDVVAQPAPVEPSGRAARSGMMDLRWLFTAVWILGSLLILGRFCAAHVALARLLRRSRPAQSSEWRAALGAATREVGLRRSVELFVNDDLPAPITSGSLHPIVILPLDAATWTAERRQIVLVHELAHVARFDALAQVVANLVCAAFWFHPGAWFAALRLRTEAECAADDRVLLAGMPGDRYATHLLDLAQGRRGPRLSPAGAVGMLTSPRLEGRFRAMLDGGRSHAWVRPRLQVLATLLSCCAMIPVAALHPVASAAPAAAVIAPAAEGGVALVHEGPTAPPVKTDATVVDTSGLAVIDAAPIPPPPKAEATRVDASMISSDTVYSVNNVDVAAQEAGGNPRPGYPAVLRDNLVEGKVILRFVVDTNGNADTATSTVLAKTHDLFEAAAKQALASYTFIPAEIRGRKVKQYAQMSFNFSFVGVAAVARTYTVDLTKDILRGQVLGPDSMPVSGVLVTAADRLSGVVDSTYTGDDGRYVLRVAYGAGDYLMSFAAYGYVSLTGPLQRELDEAVLVLNVRLVRRGGSQPSAARGFVMSATRTELIRGQVLGPDSLPLVDAVVTAKNRASERMVSTHTFTGGRYSILFQDGDGDYVLTFTADGYDSQEIGPVMRYANEGVLVVNARLVKHGGAPSDGEGRSEGADHVPARAAAGRSR